MKIKGDFKHVNELQLHLKSVDTRLNLFMEPLPYAYRSDLEEHDSVTIAFDDSREIDMLIIALDEFKKRNEAYIGYWK